MVQLQIAYLPRRGTQERWRRLCQEIAELRPEQFAAVCQQAGITQVQVRFLQLLHSELLLVSVQMQETQQTHETLASSQVRSVCSLVARAVTDLAGLGRAGATG